MPDQIDFNAAASLDIAELTPRIGAEIRDVRLSGDLPEHSIVAINAALLRHKVVFFRAQTHLTDEEQERFSLRFGSLIPHPTQKPREGSNAILELDSRGGGGRADTWHTDVTFVDAYPKISILRGVTIPPVGGDTVWSNTAAAYSDLPPALKSLAEQLWAVHSNLYDYATVRPKATEAERQHYEEVFTSTVYETEHPVVHVHPETGEPSLILGNFVRSFVGHSNRESRVLFDLLQAYVLRLENTVRWRWRQGDVVIWDNRATQHYALNDYGEQTRIVRRTTLDGIVPVSIDGLRSTTRSKIVRKPAFAAA
ncbi:TauD/TfdA dioxygenase family protein [Acidisoma silvae]|uniref:TauD/TfdA family dioxygenase n=1 Tax=Acidisoma silvae TaxID=2802396 RepID=A0A963YW24_9PROT|nr:TauD/TfdA family dioxygenase [Acidisoma silvae]MCB8878006.1 TauD/TfdA family dioxygenase [Acidisoma silvae]